MNDPGVNSTDFTEDFVERLVRALAIVPSHRAGGVAADGLAIVLQSQVGSGRRGAEDALTCLLGMRLISEASGVIGRSISGDRVRRAMRTGGSMPLAQAILRSGVMADQVRMLHEVLVPTNLGYECSRTRAQTSAPQLVGLLLRFPDVVIGGRLVIGPSACAELDSVWNELPPSSRVDWEDANRRWKAIGDRAELYSLQLERSVAVGRLRSIRWVSRDDDSLGYDIEVQHGSIRYIEVKGSSGRDVRFFLSANEYRVAGLHGVDYEIYFWGDIQLTSQPDEEYERLRAAGYPFRVIDPLASLAAAPWTITPSQYLVVRDGDAGATSA